MGIKIEIENPASMEQRELIRVIAFLSEYAGFVHKPAVSEEVKMALSSTSVVTEVPATMGNPLGVPSPAAAFGAPDVHWSGAPPIQDLAAPAAPPPPPPPQAPGIEVDAKGLPWDNRIHSGSRAKVADGTWRQKRNLDPNLLAQVEGELRQTMGLPQPLVSAPAPVSAAGAFAPTAPVADVPPPPPPAPAPAPAPAAAVPVPPPFVPSVVSPAAPVASTPPPPTPPAGVATIASPSSAVTFPELMKKITAAFAKQQLDQATIQGACAQVGLPSLPMLASRPDLVGQVATLLGIAL